MCGIAGIIDLADRRPPDRQALARMAAAVRHRGPDEAGFLVEPGVGFAHRRLSIVGVGDGQQPMANEDGSVVVVFNGEFFDYPEQRAALAAKGHQFRTHSDTEILVHLWEDHQQGMLEKLRGQFAFALFDKRRRQILLARDRVGIVPLHYARRDDRLIFGSEVKALFASGLVTPEPDPRGLDHIFTFFAMGTARTAFKDVSAILPGTSMLIDLPDSGRPATLRTTRYWDLDFPDAGAEHCPKSDAQAIEEFQAVFERAVEIRLRADVPVVSYLSGGVDSTTVATTAARLRGSPIPTFTIRIPSLDETDRALMAAKIIGAPPTIIDADSAALTAMFPSLVKAADCPVMDTSCAALAALAMEVRRQGFKVALTGEGADEALAGYPWFKANRLLNGLDIGGLRPSNLVRRLYTKLAAPEIAWERVRRIQEQVGGPLGNLELYGLVGLSRQRFYSPWMWDGIGDSTPYDDLPINLDRVRKWAPLNRSLYLNYKTLLPGLLLNHKGDRPAMAASVETRYPFLDENVVAHCAGISPKYKLKGLFRDKHLLRLMASKWLPPEIANRPKAMFRAPFANTFFENPPAWVGQLLSPEALRKTPYFDAAGVEKYRASYRNYGWSSGVRLTLEMGLTAVMATQLWHHLYFGGGLCDLPAYQAPEPTEFPRAA